MNFIKYFHWNRTFPLCFSNIFTLIFFSHKYATFAFYINYNYEHHVLKLVALYLSDLSGSYIF